MSSFILTLSSYKLHFKNSNNIIGLVNVIICTSCGALPDENSKICGLLLKSLSELLNLHVVPECTMKIYIKCLHILYKLKAQL